MRVDSGQLRVPLARAAVFQEPRLMPWKTAWKNVALGLDTPGADGKTRAGLDALTEVGLAHRVECLPGNPVRRRSATRGIGSRFGARTKTAAAG